MLSEIKKISIEQWFIAIVFVLAMGISFAGGYVVFGYWEVSACKSGIVVEDAGM